MRVTRTYLELADPGRFVPAFREVPGFRVARVEEPGPALYRRLYRTVGEAYHWRDRWDWTDDQIRTHLADPAITLYVAEVNGALAGWYELKRISSDDSVEVAYFGLRSGFRVARVEVPGPALYRRLYRTVGEAYH